MTGRSKKRTDARANFKGVRKTSMCMCMEARERREGEREGERERVRAEKSKKKNFDLLNTEPGKQRPRVHLSVRGKGGIER